MLSSKILEDELLLRRQGSLALEEVLILCIVKRFEVTSIERVGYVRHPWRLDLLLNQLAEVDLLQPRVVLDVAVTSRQAPEALSRAALEHAPDELDGRPVDLVVLLGNVPLPPYDTLEQALLINATGVEGRRAEKHFISEAAESPVVDTAVVAAAQDNLGRQIEGCPAECVCLIRDDFG